jgi:hypothetical protein
VCPALQRLQLCTAFLAAPSGALRSQRCFGNPDLTGCSSLQFTLVDASLAPFFLRLPVLKHYRGFDLPPVRLDLLHLASPSGLSKLMAVSHCMLLCTAQRASLGLNDQHTA